MQSARNTKAQARRVVKLAHELYQKDAISRSTFTLIVYVAMSSEMKDNLTQKLCKKMARTNKWHNIGLSLFEMEEEK